MDRIPSPSEINEAVEALREAADRNGRISSYAFKKIVNDYEVRKEVLAHWFKRHYHKAWTEFRTEPKEKVKKLKLSGAKEGAIERFSSAGFFDPDLKHLTGNEFLDRDKHQYVYVGRHQNRDLHEVVRVEPREKHSLNLSELRSLNQRFSSQLLQEMTASCRQRADEIRGQRTKRYRSKPSMTGLQGGKWPNLFVYIGFRREDYMHDVLRVSSSGEMELEWHELPEDLYKAIYRDWDMYE